MARIDESGLRGKIRDRPICDELRTVLLKAADAAGVDVVYVTSGGQPGTSGGRVGSTRHDGGRAADLQLIVDGKTQTFDDVDGGDVVERFVAAAAANGATGIGAGVQYMGPATLHVGFGRTVADHARLVWGAGGASANAPAWLRRAAAIGWDERPDWAYGVRDRDVGTAGLADGASHAVARIDIPRRFTLEVVKAAQASQASFRIPASVTLAQWALESDYGRRMPPGSNNPFGIKARPGEPSVGAGTTEFEGGHQVFQRAAFRAFASLDEAFASHARLLATAAAYARARSVRSDPDRFADALTGVYATDPQYGQKLRSIMRTNDLYRFDMLHAEDQPDAPVEAGTYTLPSLRRDDTLDPLLVRAMQERLVALGYNLGTIDGRFGTLTAGALLAFQRDNGLPTTGAPDDVTLAALRTADRRSLDDKRVRATEKDLADAGSQIVVDARRGRVLSWITGILGALGLGNSAVLGAAGNAGQPRATAALPDNLLPFLADVQKLQQTSPAAEFRRVAGLARSLAEQLGGSSLPPEVVQLVDQLRRAIPADVLSKNPDVGRVLDTIGRMSPAKPPSSMSTIFDILPTFFANDSVLQTVMKGVALTAGSVLPGFGGSAAILGIGLIGRLLSNRIAAARVEDHQAAVNLKALSV